MKLIAHTEAMSSFVLSKIKSYNLIRQKKSESGEWLQMKKKTYCSAGSVYRTKT